MNAVKILFIEDESEESKDTTHLLESFGYKVQYITYNDKGTLKKALDDMPDLILINITPKRNFSSNNIVSKYKNPDIPIIYLVPYSEEFLSKSNLIEPFEYILNPYAPLELKNAIENTLYKNSEKKSPKTCDDLELEVQKRTKELKEFNEILKNEIHERKKAEKSLTESKDYLNNIINSIADPVFVKDKYHRWVLFNDAFCQFFGYSREELLGKSDYDFLPSHEADVFWEKDEEVFKTGLENVNEEKFTDSKGILHTIVTKKAPYTDISGEKYIVAIIRDITERKKAENELKKANLYNRGLIESTLDPLVTIGPDGKITDVNNATEKVTGRSRNEIIGTDFSNYFTDPEKAKDGYKQVFKDQFVRDYPLEIKNKNGHITPVLYNATVYKDEAGKVAGVFAAAHDITKRQEAENEQKRLNRELHAISNCNQAMLRAVDEQTLLNDVCRIICDEAGYRLAWVGYAEHDDYKTIRPVAWAGYNSGYIANAKLSWSEDIERGRGPAGKVIRSGEIIYVQDFTNDPLMAPWRRSALQHGYRSGIALPLKDEKSHTFGVLLIYSEKPNAITKDEIKLIDELSKDLEYGITSLRIQSERKQAEEMLKDSEERMRLTMEATKIGLWDWDVKNDLWYASPIYYSMLGYGHHPGPGAREKWLKRVHPDDRAEVKEKIQNVLNQNFHSYEYEARMRHADGTYRWMSVNGFGVERDSNGKATRILGIRRDITEQKKAEEEIKLASLYNRSLIEASLDPLVTIGPNGKITDVNKATEKVTGHTRDELIGKDFSNYFTEPDKAKKGYELVFKEGFVRDYPLKIQHKEGKLTSVLYNASVYKDENDKVVGVFAAARDITEQKKAEERIQILADIVESSDDAIISKSLDGHITSWNKGAESIYGYSTDEVIGKDISILAPSHLKNEIKQLIENINKLEHVNHYETIRVRKDGTQINVSLTLSPIFDSSGNLVGISTIARDITERQKAEERLKENEEKFRAVTESAIDAIITTDSNGIILFFNNSLLKLFDYSATELSGKPASILIPVRHKNGHQKGLNSFKSGQMQRIGKTSITIGLKKDGTEFPCEMSLSSWKSGQNTYFTSIIRDLTEREKAENAIIRAKEEWENTFDAVPDLIAILDTNHSIVRANKAMANKLGVEPDEAIGLTCYKVVHGLNNPPSFCPHCKLLEDGQEHTAEVHEDRIGGDFIVTVSPLHNSDGKLIGSVHVARDITDRKKAEDKIKKSLKEKEVLLSEIHHRVKNNMQIISSLLNLQSQYATDDGTIEVLHESQDRVKAMATIYEKLYQSNDLTKLDFKNYVQSLVSGLIYSYSTKEHQITPIIEIDDISFNIETTIPCGLIISELVSNSLKHAFKEEKGKIKVVLKSLDDKFELCISDNGIGFPKDLDFRNTHSLGLQLVNNLVDQIEGEIRLDRSHGTEFKITFKELMYKKRI